MIAGTVEDVGLFRLEAVASDARVWSDELERYLPDRIAAVEWRAETMGARVPASVRGPDVARWHARLLVAFALDRLEEPVHLIADTWQDDRLEAFGHLEPVGYVASVRVYRRT